MVNTKQKEMSRVELAGIGLFFALLALGQYNLEFIVQAPVIWPFGHYWWAPGLFMVGVWVLLSVMMFYSSLRREDPKSEVGKVFGTIWGLTFIALFVMLFI